MKQRQEVLSTPAPSRRQQSSYQEQSSHPNSTQQDTQTSHKSEQWPPQTQPTLSLIQVFRNLENSGQEDVTLPIGG